MKQFKFEITLDENDLEGDEFWEDAIKRDGTGILELTDFLHDIINESNLVIKAGKSSKEILKLISYTDI